MKTDHRQKFKRQYKAKKVRKKFSKKPKLIHKVIIYSIFNPFPSLKGNNDVGDIVILVTIC